MSRLIDADALDKVIFEIGCHKTKMHPMDVMDIIKEQPTAYDVEKVVAELETFANLSEDRWVNGTSNYAYQEHKCWVKAIDIVKRGGAT